MVNFPTSLDDLPNPLASNSMLAVPHGQLHKDANDAIEALERKVGIDNSGDATSLDYRITVLELGGSGSYVQETPVGAVNGSNVTFTLTHIPRAGTLTIDLNGLVLHEGPTRDFDISGTEITMHYAPVTNSALFARYIF